MIGGEKTMVELAQGFDLHANQTKQWKDHSLERATAWGRLVQQSRPLVRCQLNRRRTSTPRSEAQRWVRGAVTVERNDALFERRAIFGHAKPPKVGLQLSGGSSKPGAFMIMAAQSGC